MADGAFATWGVPTATRGQVRISGVVPDEGDEGGGTAVTVSGSNLLGATSVTFDGTPGTSLVVVDHDEVTVATPAGDAGEVDVTIATPVGSATAVGAFEYTEGG